MKHPQKGGAEVVTDIYLSGLAKKGHYVVLFSSIFDNSKSEEKYNGYKIVRQGGKLSVYYKGLKYAKQNQDKFDIIIDQVNTIPFFTPLLIKKEKRIAFFNQLCKNVWFYETSFLVALAGYILETIYLKLYMDDKFLTISESTKNDLVKYCWAYKKNIFISEMQIDFKPINKPIKKENSFVFCGRLKNSKRVHDCIKALNFMKNKKSKIYIIGDGDEKYKKYLDKLINKLNLIDRVIFTGHISRDERNKIMAKCLAIIVTSLREGWGLIVTEANANGTLAITYNVHGLRDANKTGFITQENNPMEIAKYMDELMSNNKILIDKSIDSIAFAKTHCNWNKQVEELEKWFLKR